MSGTECSDSNGFKDRVKLLQFQDAVLQFRLCSTWRSLRASAATPTTLCSSGSSRLSQRAEILERSFVDLIQIELVIIKQASERWRRPRREPAALQLPGDRPLRHPRRVMLEVVASQASSGLPITSANWLVSISCELAARPRRRPSSVVSLASGVSGHRPHRPSREPARSHRSVWASGSRAGEELLRLPGWPTALIPQETVPAFGFDPFLEQPVDTIGFHLTG